MSPSPQFPADLVTFTEEILNRKLHFLRSGNSKQIPGDNLCDAGANSQIAQQMFNFTPPPTPNNVISNYSPNSFKRKSSNASYLSGEAIHS